jgi:integrase
MARNLLSDTECRKARPGQKPFFLQDGGGLRLRIAPSGAKSWQVKTGDTVASIGVYPVPVGLAKARQLADEARILAADGVRYAEHKREKRAERQGARDNTFAAVCRDWARREAKRQKWSPVYVKEVESSMTNHLSTLDRMPVKKILATTLGPVLTDVETRAPHMLEKIRRRLNGVMWYAVEKGIITGNPLPAIPRGKKKDRNHYPAITKLPELGDVLRKARAADPCKGVARAHLLLAFTALRVSEVVGARWDEFALHGVDVPVGDTKHEQFRHDPAAGDWHVPRARLKVKDQERGPHLVPLPPALLKSLREWRIADGSDAEFVCPAPRNPEGHVTPEAVEKFYRRALDLGGRHSPHSWRSAFSTVCREKGKDADTVESQLDHVIGDKTASAYDRAQRVELRRGLLNWYEETLIAARDGATVTELARKRL